MPIATPPSLNPARLAWYRDLVWSIAADAGAGLLATTGRFVAVLEDVAASSPTPLRVIDAEADPSGQASPAMADASACALLQYTSGSTSRPKGVPLTHANIVANASIIAQAIARERSAGVSWLPLHHDMGLIGAALTGLFSRTPVLLMPTTLFVKEPSSWLRAIGAFGGTITLAPNFAFAHAVRHAPRGATRQAYHSPACAPRSMAPSRWTWRRWRRSRRCTLPWVCDREWSGPSTVSPRARSP